MEEIFVLNVRIEDADMEVLAFHDETDAIAEAINMLGIFYHMNDTEHDLTDEEFEMMKNDMVIGLTMNSYFEDNGTEFTITKCEVK